MGLRTRGKFINKNYQIKNYKKPKPQQRSAAQALVKDLRKLMISSVKKKKPVKRVRRKPVASSPMPSPLVNIVKGILSPFAAERGTVSGLVSPRPSQKFTARGLMSVAIPNSSNFIMFVSPNVANDAAQCSAGIFWNVTGALGDATSTFSSSTVGSDPLGLGFSTLATNTPYSEGTLALGTYSWRSPSCAIRLRFTGPKLYQGGLIKYYHDTRGDILQDPEVSTLTFAALISRLESMGTVVRASFTNLPEITVPFPSVTDESQEWTEAIHYAPCNKEWGGSERMGGTTSSKKLGQPVGYVYGVNTTGSTLHFDVEMVEHWEIAGTGTTALNSPSCGHAELANSLSTLVVSAHQHLSLNPAKTFSAALKTTSRDPHVRAAFTGVASKCLTAALAML